jgi:hypothetical protein
MSPRKTRSGNKWTIPELIALEREYDLLQLTVQEIAKLHKRTILAIVSRLQSEGIININTMEAGSFSYAVLHALRK